MSRIKDMSTGQEKKMSITGEKSQGMISNVINEYLVSRDLCRNNQHIMNEYLECPGTMNEYIECPGTKNKYL